MNRPLATIFLNTPPALFPPIAHQVEYEGQLPDETSTESRGAMVSFEASHLTFAKQFLNDFDVDLDDTDGEEEDETAIIDALDRGYARIEIRLVRKHIESGALSRVLNSSATCNGPSYRFKNHGSDLGRDGVIVSPDAARLVSNVTMSITPTNHRRTSSCPIAELSELISDISDIIDIIVTPPIANNAETGLHNDIAATEIKKASKDQAPAA